MSTLPSTTPKPLVSKKGPAIYILKEGEVIPRPLLPNTPRTASLINAVNAVKRGNSGPIVTTSDEESDGCPSPRSNNNNHNNNNNSQSDKDKQKQQAFEAYEHDHDYGDAPSPSGSSTASGPIYVRPPGFKYHAQEIKKTKKKRTQMQEALLEYRQNNHRLKKRAPTPPKVRPKKGKFVTSVSDR